MLHLCDRLGMENYSSGEFCKVQVVSGHWSTGHHVPVNPLGFCVGGRLILCSRFLRNVNALPLATQR